MGDQSCWVRRPPLRRIDTEGPPALPASLPLLPIYSASRRSFLSWSRGAGCPRSRPQATTNITAAQPSFGAPTPRPATRHIAVPPISAIAPSVARWSEREGLDLTGECEGVCPNSGDARYCRRRPIEVRQHAPRHQRGQRSAGPAAREASGSADDLVVRSVLPGALHLPAPRAPPSDPATHEHSPAPRPVTWGARQ